MTIDYLKNNELPDTPGVYFFKRGREILYIGKATSLKDRVRSYFSKDLLKSRSMLIADMVALADSVAYQQTDSVLEALILEADLIRRQQPHYNTKEKDDKSFNFVVVTKEDYPAIFTIRARDLEHQKISNEISIKYQFGPFIQGGMLKEALKIIRRIFQFRDETCIPLSGKACFCHQVGLCPGPCVGAISKHDYAKNIRNIKLFFEGKKSELLRTLRKEMNSYADQLEFERAAIIKRQIFALEHIKDSSLIREEFRSENLEHNLNKLGSGSQQHYAFRIEAYDIAHMKGESMTGVMVVVEDGKAKKSDYRMFRIRRKGINDVGSIREILQRRLNHPEWQYPNLIVVDGGIAQLNVAREVLKEREFDIAVVAVTKNEKHKPKMILGDKKHLESHQKEILLANSESHRFTLKYHRKLRSKNLFS
jgi:excinuclease ABC subunit C